MTFNSVTFAALMNPSMNEAPGIKAEEQPAAAEEIKDVLRRLPHSKQTEMALVKERLDNFKREEAAANAAVAAVAKVPNACSSLLLALSESLLCCVCHHIVVCWGVLGLLLKCWFLLRRRVSCASFAIKVLCDGLSGRAGQILAIKQAAGIRARAAAAAATRDMQRLMADLDEEYGLSHILKKQRT